VRYHPDFQGVPTVCVVPSTDTGCKNGIGSIHTSIPSFYTSVSSYVFVDTSGCESVMSKQRATCTPLRLFYSCLHEFVAGRTRVMCWSAYLPSSGWTANNSEDSPLQQRLKMGGLPRPCLGISQDSVRVLLYRITIPPYLFLGPWYWYWRLK